ncbi:glycosyltransferase family 4 protein [Moritella dasanensis]|uniref:glycosyltransferase family 4 protein n=1 Tax=Moritella dasanensis TaxID=428031 RepID=UPI0002D5C8F7|nr:glycosyltransferase family 4 protein [Moritella dasanensis]
MIVLHVVHSFFGFSGASKQAYSLAMAIRREYKDNDLTQSFFTFSNSNQFVHEKDNFLIYSCRTGFRSRFVTFYRTLLKVKPDIIHFHGADFLLLLLAKSYGAKVYWKSTLYKSDDLLSLVSIKNGWLKKLIIKLIDKNNTLTLQMRKVNSQFLKEKKLVTIPNGVNIPEIPFADKKKIALIVSAIIPRKRVIEGINFFVDNLQDQGYKLIVIGPNDSSLSGFDKKYHQMFKAKLTNDISYLGEVDFSDVEIYLRQTQFLIHLSESEGMPNIVLEALSYGCYPITRDMDSLAEELFIDGISGFNIDSNKNFFIDDYKGFNIQGYNEVRLNKSFSVVAHKTLLIYKNLAGKS